MIITMFLLFAGYFLYILLKPPVENTAKIKYKLFKTTRQKLLHNDSTEVRTNSHVWYVDVVCSACIFRYCFVYGYITI
jgi:hypothetical protein